MLQNETNKPKDIYEELEELTRPDNSKLHIEKEYLGKFSWGAFAIPLWYSVKMGVPVYFCGMLLAIPGILGLILGGAIGAGMIGESLGQAILGSVGWGTALSYLGYGLGGLYLAVFLIFALAFAKGARQKSFTFRKWESRDDFYRCQRAWDRAGKIILGLQFFGLAITLAS